MKKNIFLILFCVLTIVGGLPLQSCSSGGGSGVLGTAEVGVGIVKLTNTSSVQIVYERIEKGGNLYKDFHESISPRGTSSQNDFRLFNEIQSGSYKVYVEDLEGVGYLTKSSVTVTKDSTVEVNFFSDFDVSN